MRMLRNAVFCKNFRMSDAMGLNAAFEEKERLSKLFLGLTVEKVRK